MKIITLKEEQFDAYAKNHKYRNFYQSSAYGKVMEREGYMIHYLGIIDDMENLIGASLLLYKEVFMGYKIAYAPRGFLFDYSNSSLLKEFMNRLKRLLSKQGFMSLKIDPFIPVCIRDYTGKIMNINAEANLIVENLKGANLIYHGQNLYFETEKPRFEALITLNQDIKKIYQNFDKRTRHKIKKAIRSGVEVVLGTEKELPIFYEFVKKKHSRTLTFYQNIYRFFHEDCNLYLAQLNTETFVISSKQLYEAELDRNDRLAREIQEQTGSQSLKKRLINEKIESDKLVNIYKKDLVWATNLLKDYPNGLIIGASLNLCYDKTATLFIEGFDSRFRALNPNYLLKWKMLDDHKRKDYKYFNLNAISGDFTDDNRYLGLNEMKLGFHPLITEYIGEFDFIINSLPYNLYKNLNKDKKK